MKNVDVSGFLMLFVSENRAKGGQLTSMTVALGLTMKTYNDE